MKHKIGYHGLSDNRALKMYLKEINKIPLLTPAEELDLALRLQKNVEDKWALNKLIESNLRFVVKISKGYQGRGLPLTDLIHEGNMGLIKAAERFNPDKGVKFISYAVWWIRQSIRKAIRDQSKLIRLPAHKDRKLSQIKRIFSELAQKLGRPPTNEEMAEELDMPTEEIHEIFKVSETPISLEAPIDDDGEGRMIDIILGEDYQVFLKQMEMRSLRRNIETRFEVLSPQEKKVICFRFGLDDTPPLTLEETGRKLGVTRERARQIESKAITKLKQASRPSVG